MRPAASLGDERFDVALEPDIAVSVVSRRGKGEALASDSPRRHHRVARRRWLRKARGDCELRRRPVRPRQFGKGSRSSTEVEHRHHPGCAVQEAPCSELVNRLFRTRYMDLGYGYAPSDLTACQRRESIATASKSSRSSIFVCLGAGVRVPSFEDSRIHGISNLRTSRDRWRVLRAIVRERLGPHPILECVARSSLGRARRRPGWRQSPRWSPRSTRVK